MGYQESMIFVDDLAEAAGIIRAIREFKGKEWFCVFGPERARKDLHYGNYWGWNEGIELDQCAIIPKGTLIVAVGGDRHPYQDSPDMTYLDGIVETDKEDYRECFEYILDACAKEAEADNPERSKCAYEQMKQYMEHVWDENRSYDLWYCRVGSVFRARKAREEFSKLNVLR